MQGHIYLKFHEYVYIYRVVWGEYNNGIDKYRSYIGETLKNSPHDFADEFSTSKLELCSQSVYKYRER